MAGGGVTQHVHDRGASAEGLRASAKAEAALKMLVPGGVGVGGLEAESHAGPARIAAGEVRDNPLGETIGLLVARGVPAADPVSFFPVSSEKPQRYSRRLRRPGGGSLRRSPTEPPYISLVGKLGGRGSMTAVEIGNLRKSPSGSYVFRDC